MGCWQRTERTEKRNNTRARARCDAHHLNACGADTHARCVAIWVKGGFCFFAVPPASAKWLWWNMARTELCSMVTAVSPRELTWTAALKRWIPGARGGIQTLGMQRQIPKFPSFQKTTEISRSQVYVPRVQTGEDNRDSTICRSWSKDY